MTPLTLSLSTGVHFSTRALSAPPGLLCPCNSQTATLNMRLTKSFVSASIAGNRSICFIGKAMATTKIHGCRPLTSTSLTSLSISIEPRTARPNGGHDGRFHLSLPRIRHVQYSNVSNTWLLHQLWLPHNKPRIRILHPKLPRHPHPDTCLPSSRHVSKCHIYL
jgi:hypothetical protein